MKKINSEVPAELIASFKEDTTLLGKFVKFALEANEANFKDIFGDDRGSKLYHNQFFANHNRDMSKFINHLADVDKHLMYYHIIYKA
jgi:hypothetical protein